MMISLDWKVSDWTVAILLALQLKDLTTQTLPFEKYF